MKIEVDAGAVALTPAKLIAKEARDAVANRGKLVMAVRGAKRRWLCVFGFQAVKTATNGCRHRDTYTNRRRQRTPEQILSDMVGRRCADKVPKP
jgi:hypothetical protein